ncbi:MAG TPA: rhodanese-like domain-containing protein [Actinomycetota bacterium]|nr:rhodanese-like domain-containing protein [Actinomycetota bacterium]
MTEVNRITRTELEAKLDQGGEVVVLEALGPLYFEEAHLPGALNMPPDRVDELAPELIPEKTTEVVVYCSNLACQNSVTASGRLAQLGYTNVFEYESGKQDWIEAGLATESGPARKVA